MKPRLPLALALAGLIGAGVFTTAQVAIAQQSPPAASKEEYKPTPADRAALMEARIAALHAGLALTPDQEKLWPPVESALRDFGKTIAAQIEHMREMKHDQDHPLDPIARMRQRSDNLIARGEALKKLADAGAPLYGSLTDEQKHRLPILLRMIRPHFMHHRFGMGGPGMMGRMMHHRMMERMMEQGMMGGGMMGGMVDKETMDHDHMDHDHMDQDHVDGGTSTEEDDE